jgi:fatty acid CoA ligase FadD9
MAETERDRRLTYRVDHLYATDPQFRAAAPLQEVTDADFDDFFRPMRNYFYWEPRQLAIG